MKKLILAAAGISVLAGCNLKGAEIPGAPIPFAKADYRVLGATNAEECGTYVFGIDWAHLFKNEGSSIKVGSFDAFAAPAIWTGLLGGPSSPEASRALYYAIEKMPEATHLAAPRIHTESKGLVLGPFVLFGSRCARVEARGVRIGDGPTSAQ